MNREQTTNQPALPQSRPAFSQEYHRDEAMPGNIVGTDGASASGAAFPAQPLRVLTESVRAGQTGQAATGPFADVDGSGLSYADLGKAFAAMVAQSVNVPSETYHHAGVERSDIRTNGPDVTSPKTQQIEQLPFVCLADLFNQFYERALTNKTESSWGGYRTLVRAWEDSHGGPGPDVRNIDEATLQAFFMSRPKWHSQRSWEKNRDLLFAILKSGCPRTVTNKLGHSAPVLTVDALPVWDLPPSRWFRDRPKLKPSRGGHRKRSIDLLTAEELGRVLDACEVATWKAPEFWRAWLALVWFCGPRFSDTFRYRWNSGELHINRERGLLDFTETKCGGSSAVPVPTWLNDALEPLWCPARDAKPVFVGAVDSELLTTMGQVKNRGRRIDPEYAAIWEAAGVERRSPHELRAVCVSHWLKHAPDYRFRVTGHSVGKDIQLKNYAILDDDFRQACESFPWPRPLTNVGHSA